MQSILEGFDATSFHLIDEAINADPELTHTRLARLVWCGSSVALWAGLRQ